MLRYFEGDIAAGRVNIHYYRTDRKKPPFILLHGATDNGLCWSRTAEMLAEDYDVILPDAQGHGLSDRLDDRFTFEDHTDQVAALIHGLALEKPLIMGHSMGAGTAVNLAVKYPRLPAAIILEDPPWSDSIKIKAEKEADSPPQDFTTFLTELRKLPFDQIIEQGRKLDPGWTDEDRLPWARAKQQFDNSLFSRPVINPHSYAELVPRIQCPTLLIYGDKGIVTPAVAENASRLWKRPAPFKVVCIKGATHNIRRDNFTDFYAAITAFVREIAA